MRAAAIGGGDDAGGGGVAIITKMVSEGRANLAHWSTAVCLLWCLTSSICDLREYKKTSTITNITDAIPKIAPQLQEEDDDVPPPPPFRFLW